MDDDFSTLLRINNTKKADQIVEVIWNKKENFFFTKGLKDLFGIKEIKIGAHDFVSNLEEYARVISWLLETMSTAEDFHVTFGYQNSFSVGGYDYDLTDDGNFKLLKRV